MGTTGSAHFYKRSFVGLLMFFGTISNDSPLPQRRVGCCLQAPPGFVLQHEQMREVSEPVMGGGLFDFHLRDYVLERIKQLHHVIDVGVLGEQSLRLPLHVGSDARLHYVVRLDRADEEAPQKSDPFRRTT